MLYQSSLDNGGLIYGNSSSFATTKTFEKKKKIHMYTNRRRKKYKSVGICYTLALGSLDLIDLNAENAAVPPPINR